jgi:hypothetical protein
VLIQEFKRFFTLESHIQVESRDLRVLAQCCVVTAKIARLGSVDYTWNVTPPPERYSFIAFRIYSSQHHYSEFRA